MRIKCHGQTDIIDMTLSLHISPKTSKFKSGKNYQKNESLNRDLFNFFISFFSISEKLSMIFGVFLVSFFDKIHFPG